MDFIINTLNQSIINFNVLRSYIQQATFNRRHLKINPLVLTL